MKIIAVVKEAGAGVKVAELVRKHGISPVTYYQGKSKYGWLDFSHRKLEKLEAENLKLKKKLNTMYARRALARQRAATAGLVF